MAKSKSQMRELLRGVSDQKSGPRLTLNPAKAARVRDPKTGQIHDRKSTVFQKWEGIAHAS